MCWSGGGAGSSVYLFPLLLLLSESWVGVHEGGHLKSLLSQSHKLFELCNLCCIIAGRAMCTVCVCSWSCRGVVWVDCISAYLYLFLSPQHNQMMFHSASMKEVGQLWLVRSHHDPASLISPLAAWYRSLVEKHLFSHLIPLLYMWNGTEREVRWRINTEKREEETQRHRVLHQGDIFNHISSFEAISDLLCCPANAVTQWLVQKSVCLLGAEASWVLIDFPLTSWWLPHPLMRFWPLHWFF